MFDKKILKKIKPGDAHLISNPVNSFYLSGFSGAVSPFFLTSQKAYLLTDARYTAEAEKKCDKNCTVVEIAASATETILALAKKNKIRTVYFESDHLSHSRFQKFGKTLKNISFKPSEKLIEDFRMAKSPQEIANITKAQRVAEKTLLSVIKNLKRGQSENEIAWLLEKTGRELGAENVSFTPIVGFGANSAVPHHQNTSRKLKKGDVVLIDMGFKYKGYCSDMTRVFFTAKPTPLQEKIYDLVLSAQETAIKKIKKGADSCEIDAAAREVIAIAGYEKNFLHSLGHGVGLEIHESPHLNNKECNTLRENTVITVEPGIYIQNSFGVRIEDMVLVKGVEAVNLTRFPKRIKDCIVKIK